MERPANLEQVLNELESAGRDSSTVSIADVQERIGRRSFGPLLLVPAVIAFTPLGGVPVLPTLLAAVVILLCGQVVAGRREIWLPRAIRRRSVSGDRLRRSAAMLEPVARGVDKVLAPRLSWLVRGRTMRIAIAGTCILLALAVPPLEVVPFGGTPTWIAIAAFGLALLATDGTLAIVAFVASGATIYLLFTSFGG